MSCLQWLWDKSQWDRLLGWLTQLFISRWLDPANATITISLLPAQCICTGSAGWDWTPAFPLALPTRKPTFATSVPTRKPSSSPSQWPVQTGYVGVASNIFVQKYITLGAKNNKAPQVQRAARDVTVLLSICMTRSKRCGMKCSCSWVGGGKYPVDSEHRSAPRWKSKCSWRD